MIGSDELANEREFRIQKLKDDLSELKKLYDELVIKHGSLEIHNLKVIEQHENCSKDLKDTVEKLHLTNKVRHETEVKLGEEIEKN